MTLATLLFLGSSCLLPAQQKTVPSPEEVLQRLQTNLDRYDSNVPAFFCDEHLTSQVSSDLRTTTIVADSIFRVKRVPAPDHSSSLEESRDIRSINGRPPESQSLDDLDGPSLLQGAFEGTLAVVSVDQKECMKYTLRRINRKQPEAPYEIGFATLPGSDDSDSCILSEKSSGHALIDPQTLQVRQLEIITPRHTIVPAEHGAPPVIGKRVLTVDYSPVLLGGETFWMPSEITMNATNGSNTFHVTVWSFKATYRNYHRLEVTFRIHPGTEVPTQTPPQ